jgi:hypothetical protein
LNSRSQEVLFSEDWVDQVTTVLAEIQSLNDEVREVDPPERYKDCHEEVLQAAYRYDRMAVLSIAGVNDQNADLIEASNKGMELGHDAIDRVAPIGR